MEKKLHQHKNTFHIIKNLTSEYQVIAIDKNKVESFASEPILVADEKNISIYQAEHFAQNQIRLLKDLRANGFVEISTTLNRKLSFNINVENDGLYSIDFRYANGNGPTNTENKCAIRTLNLMIKKQEQLYFRNAVKMNGAIGVTVIQ